MKTILQLIEEELKPAFCACGYDPELAKAVLSNRPDLCEYQCNGAMAGAKLYHKAPLVIAEDVTAKLAYGECLCKFSEISLQMICTSILQILEECLLKRQYVQQCQAVNQLF